MAKNKTSYNNKTSDCSNSTNSTNSTNCRNSASDKAGHAAKSAYKNTADSMKNSEDSEDEYSRRTLIKTHTKAVGNDRRIKNNLTAAAVYSTAAVFSYNIKIKGVFESHGIFN